MWVQAGTRGHTKMKRSQASPTMQGVLGRQVVLPRIIFVGRDGDGGNERALVFRAGTLYILKCKHTPIDNTLPIKD
jgi:hypothetical protein